MCCINKKPYIKPIKKEDTFKVLMLIKDLLYWRYISWKNLIN